MKISNKQLINYLQFFQVQKKIVQTLNEGMYLSVGICRFIMAINFQSIEKKTTKNYLTLTNQEITLYCKGANLLDIAKSIYAARETVRRVASSLVKQKLLMHCKSQGYCVTSKFIKKHQSYLSKEITACKKFIKK